MGNTVVKNNLDILECFRKVQGFNVHESFTNITLSQVDEFSTYPKSIEVLTKSLQNSKDVLSLDLSNNHQSLGENAHPFLAQLLQKSKTLRTFAYGNNKIGNLGLDIFILPAIPLNFLTALKLHGNEITDVGAKKLFIALKTNTSIRHLDLENNKLGDETATAFADCMQANITLSYVNLQHNQLSDEGAKAIRNMLRGNITLKHVLLFGNNVGMFSDLWNDVENLLSINTKFDHLKDDYMAATTSLINDGQALMTARIEAQEYATELKVKELEENLKQKQKQIAELEDRNKAMQKMLEKAIDRIEKLEKATEKNNEKLDKQAKNHNVLKGEHDTLNYDFIQLKLSTEFVLRNANGAGK